VGLGIFDLLHIPILIFIFGGALLLGWGLALELGLQTEEEHRGREHKGE
jgi:hypothetical protein